MSAIAFLDNHKQNLQYLLEQPNQVLLDFCKLAWDFLIKGTNMKLYASASQKLHTEVKIIQLAVEGLAHLFVEGSKLQVNEQSFKESILLLGFNKESADILCNQYLTHKSLLDGVLPLAGLQHVAYKNLSWRFETQISSRSLKCQLKPRVILKLDLEKDNHVQSVCLSSDIPNILHTSQVLNLALQESKKQNSRNYRMAM